MSSPARRSPGPVRSLTRGQIVGAGIEIMRRDGLDAVSLRSVARSLGVNPMALYTYLRDKDELLNGMFEELMRELLPPAADDPRSPEEQVVAFFVDARRLMASNADFYRLVRPSAGLVSAYESSERVMGLFLASGVAAEDVVALWEQVVHLTVGSALYASATPEGSLDDVVARSLEHLPDDAASYPLLTKVLRSARARDPEGDFAEAVRTLLRAAR